MHQQVKAFSYFDLEFQIWNVFFLRERGGGLENCSADFKRPMYGLTFLFKLLLEIKKVLWFLGYPYTQSLSVHIPTQNYMFNVFLFFLYSSMKLLKI